MSKPDLSSPSVVIQDLKNHIGQSIILRGWVANKREGKGIAFVIVRDGTGFCQCVVTPETANEDYLLVAQGLTLETSVVLDGVVKADEKQVGGIEIQVSKLDVVGTSENYPIAKKEHGIEFLMDQRHLWLRSTRQWAIMRIRNTIIFAIHEYFQGQGFVQMDAPIFTGNACEGTSTLFETDFYGETAYLSQSGQLYGEAMAMAMGRIYTFGPTFRAENSNTSRHLAEFWMIEPEVAFNNLADNMDLAEDFIKYVIKYTLDKHQDDLKFLEQRLIEEEKNKPQTERSEMNLLDKLNFVLENNFKRVTYTEAIDVLRNSNHYKKKKFQFG
mgnify:CR=1 FL=1